MSRPALEVADIFRQHGPAYRDAHHGSLSHQQWRFTYKPRTKQEQKADTCKCPVWCYGYLAKEVRIVNGRTRAKRVGPVSLGVNDWAAAEKEVAVLYECGFLPPVASAFKNIEPGEVTVKHAVKRYLESRYGASLDAVGEGTYDHYESSLNQRLIPYCEKNGILSVREFEKPDVCRQST